VLLPPPLFNAIEPHIPHHECWHVCRRPEQDELRLHFKGECGPHPFPLDDSRSGCDFLRFHRRMMRHFAWLLQTIRVPFFTFVPWPGKTLPPWVEIALRTHVPSLDLDAAYRGIEERIASGSLEELGGFIEPNDLSRGQAGAGLHQEIHRAIDRHERMFYEGDGTAPMRSIGRSPGNIFFWTLHGWIDDRFEEWQRRVGERVDRSPLEMRHIHVDCVRLPDLPSA
jgi:hypothetical protein